MRNTADGRGYWERHAKRYDRATRFLFPNQRRFTSTSLRDAVCTAGFRIEHAETIRGPFPIGFVAASTTA
jgi:hypothetical protein